jgi:hypothetical protein
MKKIISALTLSFALLSNTPQAFAAKSAKGTPKFHAGKYSCVLQDILGDARDLKQVDIELDISKNGSLKGSIVYSYQAQESFDEEGNLSEWPESIKNEGAFKGKLTNFSKTRQHKSSTTYKESASLKLKLPFNFNMTGKFVGYTASKMTLSPSLFQGTLRSGADKVKIACSK